MILRTIPLLHLCQRGQAVTNCRCCNTLAGMAYSLYTHRDAIEYFETHPNMFTVVRNAGTNALANASVLDLGGSLARELRRGRERETKRMQQRIDVFANKG